MTPKPPSLRHGWLGFAVLFAACNQTPSDLREWTPADHDHTTDPNDTQVQAQPDGGSPLARFGIDEVTVVAWRQNCARCHGTFGAGDGPQGPSTKTRDLTDATWQSATSDEAIARTIREGRGLMPAFQLPDSTVQTLVRLVRLFDMSKQQQRVNAGEPAGAAPAASGAAPAASAAPAPAASAAPAPKAAAQGHAPPPKPAAIKPEAAPPPGH